MGNVICTYQDYISLSYSICLADGNLSGIETFYYYLRLTKQCIEKKISDIDYQRLFPEILSPANILNELDDKSDEEESISNDCTLYSDNICFVVSNLWNEREKRINTNYAVTGCMLYVTPFQLIQKTNS